MAATRTPGIMWDVGRHVRGSDVPSVTAGVNRGVNRDVGCREGTGNVYVTFNLSSLRLLRCVGAIKGCK